MSSQNSILSGSILTIFLRYTPVWTLALLTMSSAGVIDSLFIGRYIGAESLVALNLVVPLYSVFIGLITMFASGGAVSVGHYFGKKKPEEAAQIFSKTMLSLFALSILITALVLVYTEPLVKFMGAKDNYIAPSKSYLQSLMLFGPILACGLSLSYFLRVDQRPILAASGLMLSAFVNIVLDYVFIVKLNMGIKGAAFATGIAYTCTFILLLTPFIFKQTRLKFTFTFKNWLEVFRSCWNGLSEFINESSAGIVMFFINLIMLKEVGAIGVAAFTIVSYSSWLAITISFGISDSIAPLISTNAGAKKFERARGFLYLALATITVFGMLMFALFTIFPLQLINLFLPGNTEVVGITLEFMSIYKWIFIFCGANMALTTYFTGYNRAGQSALIAVSRSLVLPVCFLALLPMLFGSKGIYAAIPLAELCTCIMAVFLFFYGKKYEKEMK